MCFDEFFEKKSTKKTTTWLERGDLNPKMSSDDPESAQDWVQCDRCTKWRRVPHSVAEALGDDDEW